MRKAQVLRATAFLFALFTAACVTPESWEAVRLLEDIEAGGGPSALKARTPVPTRAEVRYQIDGRTTLADFYEPRQAVGARLVLVPGFTPHGKNDPRIIELAQSLARARFLVLVPDLHGSRALQVRLEDARAIADAVAYLAGSGAAEVGVVAISYAFGLAVLASLEPEAQAKMDFLVGVGGYYDTTAVVTFATTGHYRAPGATAWRTAPPHPAARSVVLASHLDLLSDPHDRAALAEAAERWRARPDAAVDDLVPRLGPEGRALWALLSNRQPGRVAALIGRLPAPIRDRLRALSLRRYDLSHLAGRLILIHGRADPLIPYTESLALRDAVPDTALFLIDGFSHIDPATVGWSGQLQLIDAVQAVLARRRSRQSLTAAARGARAGRPSASPRASVRRRGCAPRRARW